MKPDLTIISLSLHLRKTKEAVNGHPGSKEFVFPFFYLHPSTDSKIKSCPFKLLTRTVCDAKAKRFQVQVHERTARLGLEKRKELSLGFRNRISK